MDILEGTEENPARGGLALTHSAGVQGGSASDFTDSTPPLFGNIDDNIFIRRGAATVSGFQVNVAGLGIQWGLWTSSVLAPSVRQNSSASEMENLDKFIMVSAAKTAETTIAKMKGTVEFSTSSAFIANRNATGPSVQGLTGSFTVDMDASEDNLTDGTLNLCLGASSCNSIGQVWERWQVNFAGHLTQGKLIDVELEGDIVTSDGSGSEGVQEGGNVLPTNTNRPLSGTLSGFLTGNSGEGFVAGFKIFEELEGEGDNANSIIGTAAFRLPQAISASEISALTRRGFAIVGSGTSNSGINIGQTPDFSEWDQELDEAMVYSSNPGFILRPANSTHTDYDSSINGFEIQWGRWQGTAQDPLHYQYHLSNGSIYNEIVGDVIIASATPAAIAVLTGEHYFETTEYFLGAGDTEISGISGSFDIDFASGLLSNGKFKLTSGTQTWTVNSFSGSVSNGILPKTSMNGQITYSDSGSVYEFDADITGVFLHEQDGDAEQFGFLAGFDLRKQGGSQRRYGAVLFEKVVLEPVYESAEYDAFEENGRFGFFLGGTFEDESDDRLALYGTAHVNDNGSAGATEDFISSDISDVLAIDDTPEKILQRNTAGIADLSTDVNLTGVNWGKWSTPGEGDYFALFEQYNDNRHYSNLSSLAMWVNFEPTSTANLSAIGNVTRTYSGTDSTVVGKVSHMIAQAEYNVYEIKSVFDIDFETGVLSNGLLSLCVGGPSCGEYSEIWDITYTGNFHHGVLTSFDTIQTRIDDVDTPMTGAILGAFTGNTAQHYVGGVNMRVTSDSARYVTAAFLMGQSNYLTGAEIDGLNNDQYGMLATSGETIGLFGGRSQQQGSSSNYLLADNALVGSSWHSSTDFYEDVPVNIFRRGSSPQDVDDNVLNDSGSLAWGKWSGASGAPIRRVSFNSTETTLEQDAYWFIATPSAPASLAGKYAAYSDLIAVQGGGSGGSLLKNHVTDFGFTVDLGTGTISDGNIRVENGVTWNVDFTGQARGKQGGFGPFLAFTIGNAGTIEYNPNYTFAGSMAGMFINSGNQAVLSFAFRNEHESGAGEHVSGTLAVGKEDLTVDWGDWNNSTIANLTGAIETDANTLFNNLQLTPSFVINQLEGQWRYSQSEGSGYGTGSSAGTFSDVDAIFDVDFETGVIDNGHLEVTSGTVAQKWHLHFDGAISNGSVTLTPDTGSLTITDVGTSANVPLVGAGSANLGGAFTGADGSGFVGAFDLRDSAPIIQNSVQGVFTLEKTYDLNSL